MTQHSYSEFNSHRDAHENFKAKVKEFLEKRERGNVSLNEITSFLSDCLVDHILLVDKKLGAFLKEKLS